MSAVAPRTVEHGAPLDDEPVHEVVHERLVLLELPLCAHPQAGLQRQLPGSGLGLAQHAHHRVDERVRGLPVEELNR